MKRILIYCLFLPSFFLVITVRLGFGFTIVCGKGATSDGSVILAHNEDYRGKDVFVNVHKIPGRTARMAGYLWLRTPKVDFGDSLMNEHGVVIAADSCLSREDRGQLNAGGISAKLRVKVIEEATSARHAVELAGRLIESSGYASSGSSYAIADGYEAWLLQVVKGKHWIARRVRDNEVAVVSNRYTIDEVNLEDSENYRGSKDIIQYAIKRGWYNPQKDGQFVFYKAYADPTSFKDENNMLRQWRGTMLLSKKKYEPGDPLPFSFVPHDDVSLGRCFRILRDHYEGTEYEYDTGKENQEGSPNRLAHKGICNLSTRYSFVAHLHKETPKGKRIPGETGQMVWLILGRPDANAYSPWYVAITAVPEGYSSSDPKESAQFDSRYAYWQFSRLSNLVDQHYRDRVKPTRKKWRNFEAYALKQCKKREKEFNYFLKNNSFLAVKLITNFVHHMEYRKWYLATELIEQIGK